MDTAIDLSNMPWTSVLTLASGYAGYFVAHLGIRGHHKAADVTFGTIMFGFWGLLAYQIMIHRFEFGSIASSFSAFVVAVFLGALWSAKGRNLFTRLVRASTVSQSDDLPSAWADLCISKETHAYQLSVKTLDGNIYHSDDLTKFSNHPNGPCVLGASGDILIYATHVKFAGEDDFTEMTGLSDWNCGDEITYIPASQVIRVDLRRKPR